MLHARAEPEAAHARRSLFHHRFRGRLVARLAHPVARRQRRFFAVSRPLVELVVEHVLARPFLHGRKAVQRSQPVGEVGRQFAHEAGRLVVAELAEQRAAARERERQPLARPRHPHVAEPAFLGHLRRIFLAGSERTGLPQRTGGGKDPLLEAGHPDGVELEALRGVQRHQRDPISPAGGVRVPDERELLEEPEQGGVRAPVLVVRSGRREGGEGVGTVAGWIV